MTRDEAVLFFSKWGEEHTPLWIRLGSPDFCELEGVCSVLSVENSGSVVIQISSVDLSFNLNDAMGFSFGSTQNSERAFLMVGFATGNIALAEFIPPTQ